MNSKKILQTQRLNLREYTLEDASFILKLVNTPGWLTFIGDRNVHSIEDAKTFLTNSIIKSYKENGYGLWMIQLQEDKTPIGMCGLVNREALEDVDVGFALLPEFAKKGYAFEAANATVEFAKNSLEIEKIVGITNAKNKHSIALLNKLGMYFEKEVQLAKDDVVQLYSPKREIHILNGDALKEQFPSEVNGEIIVARECMVDGSVMGNTIEEIFSNRATFIAETFDESKADYYAKSVSEFKKMDAINKHSEINLWFEDDLFCQVNFWFVLHYLLEKNIESPIYLIRPIEKHQYGFEGMNKMQLQAAFQNKMKLNHVKEVSKLWTLFQKGNISEMIQLSEVLKEEYPFILPAVKALKESIKNNHPKNSIKIIIEELNTIHFGEVFKEFCKREAIYGYGDVQVKRLFDEVMKELKN